MTAGELAALLDHSVLKPEATEQEIFAGAALVRELAIGYYCVQPCWVRHARTALSGSPAKVVAAVGFPHGCEESAVKAKAAELAIEAGAGEIDMVMNFGLLKSRRSALVLSDLEHVVQAAGGVPVKVILEAAVLDDGEKRLACRLAMEAGAKYVKSSTGFHPAGGARLQDVRLMRAAVGPSFGVKAAGGIRNIQDALAMIAAGASRIGTSASEGILRDFPPG